MTPDRLIELARNAGMFVTTEMKWQHEKWETLAKLISEEPACTWPKGRCACDELLHNVELTGAAQLYRAASCGMTG